MTSEEKQAKERFKKTVETFKFGTGCFLNRQIGDKLKKYYMEYLDSPTLEGKAIELKNQDIQKITDSIAEVLLIVLEREFEERKAIENKG